MAICDIDSNFSRIKRILWAGGTTGCWLVDCWEVPSSSDISCSAVPSVELSHSIMWEIFFSFLQIFLFLGDDLIILEFQKYEQWRDGLPDMKWLNDVFPDNDQWQSFSNSVINLTESLKNSIEIGELENLEHNGKWTVKFNSKCFKISFSIQFKYSENWNTLKMEHNSTFFQIPVSKSSAKIKWQSGAIGSTPGSTMPSKRLRLRRSSTALEVWNNLLSFLGTFMLNIQEWLLTCPLSSFCLSKNSRTPRDAGANE